YKGVSNNRYNYKGVVNESIDDYKGVSNDTNEQQGFNKSTNEQQGVNNNTYDYHPVNTNINNYHPVSNTYNNSLIDSLFVSLRNTLNTLESYLYIIRELKGIQSTLIELYSILKNNTLETENINKIIEVYNLIGVSDRNMLESVNNNMLEGVNNSSKQQGVNNRNMLEGINNNMLEGVNDSSMLEGVNNTSKQQGVNNSSKQQGVNNSSKQQGFNNSIYHYHPVNNNTYKQQGVNNTPSFNNPNTLPSIINTLYWCNESIKRLKQSMSCYLQECRENSPLLCFVSDIDILRGLSDIYNIIGVIIKVYEIEGVIYNEYEIKGCYYKEERLYFITPIKLRYNGSVEGVRDSGALEGVKELKCGIELEGVNDKDNDIKGVSEEYDIQQGVSNQYYIQQGVSNSSSNIKGVSEEYDIQQGVNNNTNPLNNNTNPVNNNTNPVNNNTNTLKNNLVRIINTFNYEITRLLINMFYNKNRDLHVIDELISEYSYFKGVNSNSKREMINYKISVINKYIKEKRGVINLYPRVYKGRSESIDKEGVSDRLESIDMSSNYKGVSNKNNIIDEGVSNKDNIIEGVRNKNGDYKGVSNKNNIIDEGVSNKDNIIEGVRDKDNIIEGVSNKSSNYKGVSNKNGDYKGVNNTTNTTHPFTNNNTTHPFTKSLTTTTYNTLYSFDTPYGFNYYPPPSLILTPLTITVLSYISLSLLQLQGVILYGPSGTGKTETVKYYSRLKGKRLITFCCNNTCSYDTLNNIFYGCYKTNSYVCFDEFNRLTKEVMSTVEDLILYYKGVKVFLTMNLGYKGRYELPRTLKGVLGIINVEGVSDSDMVGGVSDSGNVLKGDSDRDSVLECVNDSRNILEGVSDNTMLEGVSNSSMLVGVSNNNNEQQGVSHISTNIKGDSNKNNEQQGVS
ncbi:hypothetical protein CWI38_2380p0010, partial [Hamiltosporidium tvaerminnensis]